MIPGESPVIEALVQAIERAALEPSEVLLVGEPGTGKEHLARELHRRSNREGSLLTLDCATVDPRGLEQRLFGSGEPGHEPSGAFHTERGCTLFLDAVEALPRPLQAKLLRALQAAEAGGRTDVRVVAATHLALEERVAAGGFLRELHARFAGGELHVPALRERRGDLMAWLERLHTSWIEQRPDHPVETLALMPESAERLLLHAWPGNLHELGRLVHELASDLELPRPIPLERLPGWILGATPDLPTQPVQGPPAPGWPHDVRS
jgi:DNA-binding NtrC family response regulator